jgi:hypothetical protein
VYIPVKLQVDLQADKSSVVVKGPFFPQVWTQGIESLEQCAMQCNNWTMCKAENFNVQKENPMHLILKNIMKMNLIYENRR